MEEILRLEREIEKLQWQQQRDITCKNTKNEIKRQREEEIQRLEKEASRVAQEFLELLDFGNLDESVQGLERSLSNEGTLNLECSLVAPLAEEEEDEGFPADEEGPPVPSPSLLNQDSTRTSDNYYSEEDTSPNVPVHRKGGEEGETSLLDLSVQRPASPQIQHVESIYHSVSEILHSDSGEAEDPIYSLPPDVESDYDHEEFEGSGDVGSASAEPLNGEEALRNSHSNGVDSYCGSMDSVRSFALKHQIDMYVSRKHAFSFLFLECFWHLLVLLVTCSMGTEEVCLNTADSSLWPAVRSVVRCLPCQVT